MRINVKIVMAVIVTSALLTQASYAQPAPLEGMSPREKARYDAKLKSEKDTDQSYKSSLDHIPDVKQKPDPWGNLRTPDPPSNAASKK
jgi:hypothetical protein